MENLSPADAKGTNQYEAENVNLDSELFSDDDAHGDQLDEDLYESASEVDVDSANEADLDEADLDELERDEFVEEVEPAAARATLAAAAMRELLDENLPTPRNATKDFRKLRKWCQRRGLHDNDPFSIRVLFRIASQPKLYPSFIAKLASKILADGEGDPAGLEELISEDEWAVLGYSDDMFDPATGDIDVLQLVRNLNAYHAIARRLFAASEDTLFVVKRAGVASLLSSLVTDHDRVTDSREVCHGAWRRRSFHCHGSHHATTGTHQRELQAAGPAARQRNNLLRMNPSDVRAFEMHRNEHLHTCPATMYTFNPTALLEDTPDDVFFIEITKRHNGHDLLDTISTQQPTLPVIPQAASAPLAWGRSPKEVRENMITMVQAVPVNMEVYT